MIALKSADEIARIEENGALLAEVLDLLGRAVAPGLTTGELDRMAASRPPAASSPRATS